MICHFVHFTDAECAGHMVNQPSWGHTTRSRRARMWTQVCLTPNPSLCHWTCCFPWIQAAGLLHVTFAHGTWVGGSEQPWEEDRQICLVLLSTSFWLMYVCYEVHLHDSPTSRSVIPVLWPELTWDWSCKWVHDLMYFKGNSIKFFQVHICSYVWPPAWSPMCWSQLSGPTSLERAKSKGSWD